MKTIEYYFDFISPYSFFSFHNPIFNKFKSDTKIIYKPCLLSKLLSAHEAKGPGEIEPKRNFMLRQCFRYAHKNNLKFKTPPKHPFNPLYALRISTLEASGELQERVIEAFWEASWQEEIKLDDPDIIISFLNSKNLPGQELLDNSFKIEAKNEVKNNTKEAISKGAFGVPSFIYQDELFWGNDALEDLELTMLGKDDWDRENYQQALENNLL